MSHTVHIPTPLRQYTDKLDTVQVGGATVGDLLTQLTTIYPELKKHLYNEQGKLRHFVNIYVNDEDIRYLQKEQTSLGEKDTISIIPSVAGGSQATAELPALEQEEIARYSRHLILPEVGVEGQKKLKAANISFSGVSFPNITRDEAVVNTELCYYRYHGVPKLFYSEYDESFIRGIYNQVMAAEHVSKVYIYFNNTASMAALHNARYFLQLVENTNLTA